MALLVISSELPELLGLADRVVVMQNGRITGELDRAEATEERILALAMADDLSDEGGRGGEGDLRDEGGPGGDSDPSGEDDLSDEGGPGGEGDPSGEDDLRHEGGRP